MQHQTNNSSSDYYFANISSSSQLYEGVTANGLNASLYGLQQSPAANIWEVVSPYPTVPLSTNYAPTSLQQADPAIMNIGARLTHPVMGNENSPIQFSGNGEDLDYRYNNFLLNGNVQPTQPYSPGYGSEQMPLTNAYQPPLAYPSVDNNNVMPNSPSQPVAYSTYYELSNPNYDFVCSSSRMKPVADPNMSEFVHQGFPSQQHPQEQLYSAPSSVLFTSNFMTTRPPVTSRFDTSNTWNAAVSKETFQYPTSKVTLPLPASVDVASYYSEPTQQLSHPTIRLNGDLAERERAPSPLWNFSCGVTNSLSSPQAPSIVMPSGNHAVSDTLNAPLISSTTMFCDSVANEKHSSMFDFSISSYSQPADVPHLFTSPPEISYPKTQQDTFVWRETSLNDRMSQLHLQPQPVSNVTDPPPFSNPSAWPVKANASDVFTICSTSQAASSTPAGPKTWASIAKHTSPSTATVATSTTLSFPPSKALETNRQHQQQTQTATSTTTSKTQQKSRSGTTNAVQRSSNSTSHKSNTSKTSLESSTTTKDVSTEPSNSHSTPTNGTNIPNGTVTPAGVLGKDINPPHFDISPKRARFFVMKSYSEEDVHRSIKYGIWCSTDHGNKRLDSAYQESVQQGIPVYLFFSVNGSGHFCGMAVMVSSVDYDTHSHVWAENKWRGQFRVKWIYVKDVPNLHLRHIRVETNENKPVTNSRDATEIPLDKGKQMLKVMHQFHYTTCLFQDYDLYEQHETTQEVTQAVSS